ncbi:MAG: hypothetical protein ACD_71C00017G0007 [uncultured bacterium (gcode 4)]|uniref:Uncharacterized protein n=1 Tax=uncultured bacterium (gcode 4) TaxID=1234023 RepID=K1YP95_9BACT|nr:MAG: hypothetical protein ACD_71C00017G0007 [uncultured bacterium (gcode 4)]
MIEIKKIKEPERSFSFKFGRKPPLQEDWMRYIRFVLEGRFKGFGTEFIIGASIIASLVFFLIWWFQK